MRWELTYDEGTANYMRDEAKHFIGAKQRARCQVLVVNLPNMGKGVLRETH